MTYNRLLESDSGEVWRYFREISDIPRPSKYEDRVRDYLRQLATDSGWPVMEDATGNLVMSVPGRGKRRQAPTLVLQGHMDMVCEKNSNVVHDFMCDPIRLLCDNDWVTADGTTLGADNGIALALMLAVADLDVPDRVPLELLFTVDEETGLTGAMSLNKEIVSGRLLLNLDSEEDGVFIIGCAGGQDFFADFERVPLSIEIKDVYSVQIKGLRGGHSGVNINDGRENSIINAAKILTILSDEFPDLRILSFSGGNKKNAIPRECRFVTANVDRAGLEIAIESVLAKLRPMEKNVAAMINGETAEASTHIPIDMVNFLVTIPNGVISMDPHFSAIVQASLSTGVVSDGSDTVGVLVHGRSSDKSILKDIEKQVRNAALSNNSSFRTGASYSGWNPNPRSVLLKEGKRIYKRIFAREPRICAIHAGLETGIIGDILGTDELLSVGPTIEDPHSPDERLNIQSVENLFTFLKQFVTEIDVTRFGEK